MPTDAPDSHWEWVQVRAGGRVHAFPAGDWVSLCARVTYDPMRDETVNEAGAQPCGLCTHRAREAAR